MIHDSGIQIDKEKKEKSLAVIRAAADKKFIRSYPSFVVCFARQVRFQSFTYWAAQGCALMSLFVFIWFSGYKKVEGISLCLMASIFLVVIGNMGLAWVGKSFSYHMAELEKTMYMDLKQLICVRLLLGGITDLIVVGFLAGFLGVQFKGGLSLFLLYILVPFLWTDVCYLKALTMLRGGLKGYRQFSALVLCGSFALLPAVFPRLYREGYIIVWNILLIAGVAMLVNQLHKIFQKIDGGDILCLN